MSASASTTTTPPPSDSLQYGARAPVLNPAVTHRVTPTARPYRVAGRVVRGFQRGSAQLGYPTANLDPAAFATALPALPRGVYCGYLTVDSSPPHATVLSLGVNPTYGTAEETLECYVMGWVGGQFYGAMVRLVVCGFVRPQWTMGGVEELIAWIRADVEVTERALQQPPYVRYRDDAWLTQSEDEGEQRKDTAVDDGTDRSATTTTNGTERLRSNV